MAKILWRNENKYSVEIRENTGMIVEGESVQIIQEERFTKGTVLLSTDEILAIAEIIKNQGTNQTETFRTAEGNRIDYTFDTSVTSPRLQIIKNLKEKEEYLDSLFEREGSTATVEFPIVDSALMYGMADLYYDEEDDESYLSVTIMQDNGQY